jgi:cytochrome c oxidase cbb3-type subunit III
VTAPRFALALAMAPLLLGACEREEREPRPDQAAAPSPEAVTMPTIRPGSGAPPEPSRMGEEYEQSAWHVSEGKRLYTWFNCNGCHGNAGGGGMGPALMDDKWIYGGDLQSIAATLLQGRPNGMPSWRGRIPDEQIWQIAAYVRSMGRYVRQDVAPGRTDDMQTGKSESRRPRLDRPGSGDIPQSAQRPQ